MNIKVVNNLRKNASTPHLIQMKLQTIDKVNNSIEEREKMELLNPHYKNHRLNSYIFINQVKIKNLEELIEERKFKAKKGDYLM